MKSEVEKVEVIFNEELNAKNKLVRFIINKILEEHDVLEGMVGEYGTICGGRTNIKDSNRSI